MNEYNYDELRKVVAAFREAIVTARKNRDFDRRDRMSNFPGGCCDDACDLLSYYLYEKFGIRTRQGNGLYDDGVFENRTTTLGSSWTMIQLLILPEPNLGFVLVLPKKCT